MRNENRRVNRRHSQHTNTPLQHAHARDVERCSRSAFRYERMCVTVLEILIHTHTFTFTHTRSGSSRRWGTARRRRAAPSRPTRARASPSAAPRRARATSPSAASSAARRTTGALRPRHGRRSRGWARRALRRRPRQGPTGRPHRHRDHRRGAPRCGGDAVPTRGTPRRAPKGAPTARSTARRARPPPPSSRTTCA